MESPDLSGALTRNEFGAVKKMVGCYSMILDDPR
jgi:hypothetical protein